MRPVDAEPSSPSVKRMLSDLLRYDPNTRKWTVLESGPSRRKGCSLTAYRDRSLFLFGGAGPGISHNDLWEYRIDLERWIDHTPRLLEAGGAVYPAPRAYHVSAIHNDKLIIFGGFGTEIEEEGIWIYDIQTESLKYHPTFGEEKCGRFGVCSWAYDGGLFVTTGQKAGKLVPSTLHRLDLSTLLWHELKVEGSVPPARTYAAATMVDDSTVLLHGGSTADAVYLDSYELDLRLLCWRHVLNLDTQVSLEGHTATALYHTYGATLLLIGGATGGPAVPKGPIMEANFLFKDNAADFFFKTLSEAVISPPELGAVLWEAGRDASLAQIREDSLKSAVARLSEGKPLSSLLLRLAVQSWPPCRSSTSVSNSCSWRWRGTRKCTRRENERRSVCWSATPSWKRRP